MPWREIADSLASTAGGPEVERYTVVRASPLMLDEVDGDNVLEDGDDDFVLSAAVEDVEVGDIVRVMYADDEYTVIGVDA